MSDYSFKTTAPLELIEPDETIFNGSGLQTYVYNFDSKRHRDEILGIEHKYKALLRENVKLKRKVFKTSSIQAQSQRKQKTLTGAFGAQREL